MASKRNRPAAHTRGFTLVELMVAIGILSLVIYYVPFWAMDAWRRRA